MTVTITDIARSLHLSIAAVSRALGGYPDISEATRQRVIRTASEMGYVPNQAARQLRRRKADAIGYILPFETPRFAAPFISEFISGLGDETAQFPFDLLVSIAPPGDAAEQRIYQKWVQSRKVDGFILDRVHLEDWRVRYLSEQAMPFAALEHTDDSADNEHPADYPCVEIDNQAGMLALVNHLASQGYRRLAYIGGPPTLKIQSERLAGFYRGVRQVGLRVAPYWVVSPGQIGHERHSAGQTARQPPGAFEVAERLLAHPDPPDAFICIDDETAFEAMHAVRARGLVVGQDVAVTGFDGVQLSAHSEPPLTTLDVPIYAIARKLVQMLAVEINCQPMPGADKGHSPDGLYPHPPDTALLTLPCPADALYPQPRVMLVPELVVRASSLRSPAVD